MNNENEVEDTSKNTPVQVQEGVQMVTTNRLTLEDLSRLQLDRYYAIEHRYGHEASLEILSHIKARGKNCWAAFVKKSTEVHNADDDELNYFKALSDAFELHTDYDRHAITEVVCELRARFKLSPFTDNITGNCIGEFHKVFFVEEEMVDNEGRPGKHRVYKPVYRILAE